MNYNFILKLANEFEVRLKEQMEREENLSFNEAYLLSLGAIPVETFSDLDLSYLGSGGYSTVYKVIYQGKPAVAKITDSKNDILALEKLNAIKQSLPSDVQKHILNVYYTKYNSSFYDDDWDWESYNVPPTEFPNVAIVEELEPLSSDIINQIYGDPWKENQQNIYNNIINKIKNNNQFLKAFIRGILINDQNPKDFILLKKVFIPIFKKLESLIYNFNFSKNYYVFIDIELFNLLKLIKESLINILKEINKKEKIYLKEEYLLDYVNECNNKIKYFFENLTESFLISSSSQDASIKAEILKTYPESKSLIKLLNILKNKYNIRHEDLHSANIMQRKNKDIVISDPGLFKFL